MKFSQLKNQFAGGRFAPDDVRTDRMIVESKFCRQCRRRLEYLSFSNAVEYYAFGVCEPCDYAREFFAEKTSAVLEIAI